MNKRKLKKRCKRGGHYHFDNSIKVITKKQLMHPQVTMGTFGPVISWSKIGSCLTCNYCTDVMVDWNGTIYACYSTKINCGGCDNYMCKRYKLNPNTKFFKREIVTAQSEPSDLKRYIEEQIKEHKTVTARIRDKEFEEWKKQQEFMKNRPSVDINIAEILKAMDTSKGSDTNEQ